MRITYSPSADTAYLYLTDEPLSALRESVPCQTPDGVDATVILDWKEGKLVGLEVIGASQALHADFMAEADQ